MDSSTFSTTVAVWLTAFFFVLSGIATDYLPPTGTFRRYHPETPFYDLIDIVLGRIGGGVMVGAVVGGIFLLLIGRSGRADLGRAGKVLIQAGLVLFATRLSGRSLGYSAPISIASMQTAITAVVGGVIVGIPLIVIGDVVGQLVGNAVFAKRQATIEAWWKQCSCSTVSTVFDTVLLASFLLFGLCPYAALVVAFAGGAAHGLLTEMKTLVGEQDIEARPLAQRLVVALCCAGLCGLVLSEGLQVS